MKLAPTAKFGMMRYGLVLLSLLPANLAAAASLSYTDGICEYRVAYDPAKVESARLKATFGYLNDGAPPLELGPTLATAEDIAKIDVAAYHARCAAHRRKLEARRFIDLPGIEALRQREIADLDETCKPLEASLAAAKGDLQPIRTISPACTRYADLLALPAAGLKMRWNDLVLDLCQSSTEVNLCAGQMQRDGEGPGSEARRRIAVVTRWRECASARKMDEVGAADTPTDRERRRLRDLLAKRFKAKTLSCAQ